MSDEALLEDVRAYLERVCDWYEGGELPGEVAAKRLIERIHDAQNAKAPSDPVG